MGTPSFIAMNRFKVVRGSEDAFEALWRSRESHLHEVPGFVSFRLLRSPAGEEYTLFASHTIWRSQEAFVAWTQSEQFRKAHAHANDRGTQAAYLGHPEFEGFHVVHQLDADRPVAAPAAVASAAGVT
ncbi:MAG: antibiotic biosynthesis monooxygenase [Acidobacteria bacterium]|nr:antibiotic biosynthesis monooxygenase [Acidobacteriota bacterium]